MKENPAAKNSRPIIKEKATSLRMEMKIAKEHLDIVSKMVKKTLSDKHAEFPDKNYFTVSPNNIFGQKEKEHEVLQ